MARTPHQTSLCPLLLIRSLVWSFQKRVLLRKATKEKLAGKTGFRLKVFVPLSLPVKAKRI